MKKHYIEYKPDSYNIHGCFPYRGDPIPEEELAYYGRGSLNKWAVFGILEQDKDAFMLMRLSRDIANRIIPHYYMHIGSNGEWRSISKDELAQAAYNAQMSIER